MSATRPCARAAAIGTCTAAAMPTCHAQGRGHHLVRRRRSATASPRAPATAPKFVPAPPASAANRGTRDIRRITDQLLCPSAFRTSAIRALKCLRLLECPLSGLAGCTTPVHTSLLPHCLIAVLSFLTIVGYQSRCWPPTITHTSSCTPAQPPVPHISPPSSSPASSSSSSTFRSR